MTSDSPVDVGKAMHFKTTVTGDTPITFTWNFGGAGSGVGLDTATPIFTYTHVGTYTVALTATNTCPSEETDFITVRVNDVTSDVYLPIVLRQ